MVSDKVFTPDGSVRIFQSDFEVLSEDHIRVYIDGTVVSKSQYDLINGAAVFSEAPSGTSLIVQVGTTPADILTTPSEAGIVAANIDNVVLAGQSVAAIQTVADNILDVNTNATNIVAIQNASANADTAIAKAQEASDSASTATEQAGIASAAKEVLVGADGTGGWYYNDFVPYYDDVLVPHLLGLVDDASISEGNASTSAEAALASENAAKDSEDRVVAKEALMSPHYVAIESVADINANITTVAGISADVTAAVTNATNITTVATNIDEININADNIEDIKTNASDIGNINLVGSDLSNEYTHIEDSGSINDAVTGGTGTSNVKTVADSIVAVDRLGDITTSTALDRLNTGNTASNMDRLKDSADDIDRVNASIVKVDRVYTSINKIDVLHDSHLPQIDALAERTSEIDILAPLSIQLTRLGTASAVADMDVLNDAGIISDMNVVANNTADVSAVARDMSSVTSMVENLDTLVDYSTENQVIAYDLDDKELQFENHRKLLESVIDTEDMGNLSGTTETEAYGLTTEAHYINHESRIKVIAGDTVAINEIYDNRVEIYAADTNATTATTQAGIATTQAGIATTKANEASMSAAAALVSENATKDSENIVVAKEALVNPHYGNISLVGSDLSNEYAHIDDAGSINDAVAGGTGTSNVKTVASNITIIDAVGTNITNVNTVAGIASDVTAVVADATDIGVVSTNIGNVSIVGNDLANNFAYIDDHGSITGAVTSTSSTSNVKAVADDITDVNLVGGSIADVTIVANDLTLGATSSINKVSSDIGNVNTVSTNISNVNTVANDTTEINEIYNNRVEIYAADTNAATATTQAGIATTQAGNASTSATNADTSEANTLDYKNQTEIFKDRSEDILNLVSTNFHSGEYVSNDDVTPEDFGTVVVTSVFAIEDGVGERTDYAVSSGVINCGAI